jgi:hypothetical protein
MRSPSFLVRGDLSGMPIHTRSLRCGASAAISFVCAVLITSCATGQAENVTFREINYGWTLPISDVSSTGSLDGEIYEALRGSCGKGEQALWERWSRSLSPRDVLLFEAGVHLCRGNIDQARNYYDRAQKEYGWSGLAPPGAARCDLYQSVASVLEKAPRGTFTCLDGASPDFRRSATGVPDNPLTAQDESAAGVEPPPPAAVPDPALAAAAPSPVSNLRPGGATAPRPAAPASSRPATTPGPLVTADTADRETAQRETAASTRKKPDTKRSDPPPIGTSKDTGGAANPPPAVPEVNDPVMGSDPIMTFPDGDDGGEEKDGDDSDGQMTGGQPPMTDPAAS